MAGNVEHLQPESRRIYYLSFVIELIRWGRDDRDAERAAEVEHRVGEHCGVAAADAEGGLRIIPLQFGVAGNVVDVAVRVEDQRRRQRLAAEQGDDRVRLEAGVDD